MKGSYADQINAARLLLGGLKSQGKVLAKRGLTKAAAEVKKLAKLDLPKESWKEFGITDAR